ncbi:diguanylate cyclase (GGDEF)-like protein [Mesorhizobium soli]|uniref:GGDEF domain-containing protein n=1 Tax=Pseudaminobacter soli (ex Li et al. 2025) TaxID=1295366 RepID=UPI002475E3A8|nr:GGDEF domain-containing protein [Mesorhizobium soli]MDH6230824.1 diguanylate cyclase (GGDEF)-like protein [Mesorhizobium soli]
MKLDFLTLYLVILLNSLTLTVVWGAITVVYRGFDTARYWLAASILTTVGGGMMMFEGGGLYLFFGLCGNALVIFGFCVERLGVLHFHGERGGWTFSLGLTAIAVCAMYVARDSQVARNVVYATAQIVPLSMAAIYLLQPKRRSLGAMVTVVAMAVGIVGQGTEAVLNSLRLLGELSTEGYYKVGAFCLLTIIFGAMVWNVGFLLMAVDRLQAELAQLAGTDELTGLPNRRSFVERLAAEMPRARRSRRGFSVLLLDLDNFKTINDSHGHAAGDHCVQHFARLAVRRLRGQDLLARTGGDEFCILLPETSLQQAAVIAEELVHLLAANDAYWRGHSIPVTISVGVAEWAPAAAMTVDETLEAADMALYEAKRNGRNGYALAQPTGPEPAAEKAGKGAAAGHSIMRA